MQFINLAIFAVKTLQFAYNLNSNRLNATSYTINLINFPSRTNISGYLKNNAQIWLTLTGAPSFRTCSRRELISHASVSADIPRPSVESRYTIASSILI